MIKRLLISNIKNLLLGLSVTFIVMAFVAGYLFGVSYTEKEQERRAHLEQRVEVIKERVNKLDATYNELPVPANN